MLEKLLHWKYCVSIMIVWMLMLFVCYYSSIPWNIADDYYYTYHWETGEELKNVRDVLSSQWFHYQDTNGRFVAHTIVQIFNGLLGQNIFAFVNAVVYMLFVLCICKLLKIRRNDSLIVFLISMILIVCLRTRFVASHQVGYIWMPLLSLFYLWIFFFKAKQISSLINVLWLIPFGIIAGNGQETFNVGISVALFIYIIKNKRTMTRSQWWLFVSFCVGMLMLILSPGTLKRAGENPAQLADAIIIWLSSLRATYILVLICVIWLIKKKNVLMLYYGNEFWINAWIVSFVFNLCIGVYGYRQLLGMELFASIIIINLIKQNIVPLNIKIFVIISFFILMVCRIMHVDNEINHSNELFSKIEQLYINSDDGVVYYDIKKEDMSLASLFNGEACYLLGGMFTETLGDFIDRKTGIDKDLIIYPTILRNPNSIEIKNKGWECANGHMLYVIDKENRPNLIRQKRNFSLCGLEFIIIDKIIPQTDAIYENDNMAVYEYYQGFDFIRNSGVEFDY